MNRILTFLILGIAIILSSCNSIDEPIGNFPHENKTDIYKVTVAEAEETVVDFLLQMDLCDENLSRSVSTKREIADVQAIRNTSVVSRSIDMAGIDTLMYIVNFKDEQGFAIVGADKRTESIIAFVETGTFSLDSLQESTDEGLLSFIDDAIQMELNDIKDYGYTPSSRSLVTNGYTISSYYKPILHTRWTQDGIYGKYCPNKIAGCAIIATAQILSHFQTLGQVNWSYNGTGGSAILHWDKIISDCDKYNGRLTASDCYSSGDEIAHLVRYLGIALDANYKKDSTGCGESKAIDWFNKWGGLKASKLKDYNETAIVNAIKGGNPVYARGNSGKKKVLGIRVGWKGGHAWVYDGTLTASKDNKTSTFVHCNWGWDGRNNGYYISKAFDTNAGAIIYDNAGDYQSAGTSNYKYHLQYSIITR